MAVPSWLQAIPAGAWGTIPGSNFFTSSAYAGTGAYSVVTAWSGGVLNTHGLYIGSTFTTGTFLVLFGGGHTDYGGNEVYAFGPLESDSPSWNRLRDATSPAPQNVDFDGSGNPPSRHTYDSICYVYDGTRNWMVSIGAIGRYSDAAGGAQTYVYDFGQISPNSNQPWSLKTAPSFNGDLVAYEPSSGNIWYHPSDQNKVAFYNVASDTHTTYADIWLNPKAFYGGNAMSALDTNRGIWAFWDNNWGLSFYQTNNGVNNDYFVPTQIGPIPANANGSLLWDPVDDRFILWRGDAKAYWPLHPPFQNPY